MSRVCSCVLWYVVYRIIYNVCYAKLLSCVFFGACILAGYKWAAGWCGEREFRLGCPSGLRGATQVRISKDARVRTPYLALYKLNLFICFLGDGVCSYKVNASCTCCQWPAWHLYLPCWTGYCSPWFDGIRCLHPFLVLLVC